jgi:hypothetical protein
MKREREGRKPAASAPKAAPSRSPARAAAPSRTEPRAPIEARATDTRGDDDDGGFFRGGAV